MLLAFSTATLDPALPADAAVARFRALADGAGAAALAVAVDPRLGSAQQAAWIECFRAGGVSCAEVAHPFVLAGRRRGPMLTSDDRDEQRAAARRTVETIYMAADHQVPRVVVYPGVLDLRPAVEQLQRAFALAEEPPHDELAARRLTLAAPALDGVRAGLELSLESAARLGVEVALPGPCPWPHQLPCWLEVEGLLREFAGAPLAPMFFMDWAHAAGELETLDRFPSSTRAVRVADACGLRLRLPLGAGEARWPTRFAVAGEEEEVRSAGLILLADPPPVARGADKGVPSAAPEEVVITLDQGCATDELRRSLDWVAREISS